MQNKSRGAGRVQGQEAEAIHDRKPEVRKEERKAVGHHHVTCTVIYHAEKKTSDNHVHFVGKNTIRIDVDNTRKLKKEETSYGIEDSAQSV